MAPRFKRKRQTSHSSSRTGTLHGQAIQSNGFKPPSYLPDSSHQRQHTNNIPSEAHRRHQLSPDFAPPQVAAHNAADNGELDGDLEQVVMAIDRQQKGAMGCAYYVAREEKLYCLQDLTTGNLDAIDALKMEVQPTMVLLSPRVDLGDNEPEAARMLRLSSLVGDTVDEPPLPYQVEIRPSQEFGYEGAKTKLINLETTVASNENPRFLVPGDAFTYEDEQDHEDFGSTDRQGKLLRLSSWIDLENRIGIGCVGAILTYLQRRRAANYLPEDPDAQRAFRVRALEMFSLQDTMFLNADTLLSLQIMQPESHPNVFNQGPGSTGSKESLSIYGLFHHHARTPQGKLRLRQVFLRPALKLEHINSRLDFISIFVRPDNLVPLQKLSKSMSKIKNIRTVITHLHKGINEGNQKPGGFRSGAWATLLEFAYHTIDIRDILHEIVGGEHLPLLEKANNELDIRSLQGVGTSIYDIVDLEASVGENRTAIKRGIHDQLDDLKNTYDGMNDLLSRTAVDIARTVPDHVALKLNVIYFPQLGYHITVPLDSNTRQPLYEGDPNDAAGGGRWERMFTTENQVYLKDARMREMDVRLGDLWNMICNLEIEISYGLAQRVLQHEEMLVAVSDLCGELDCMFALSQGVIQHNLVRPRMTEENLIDIKNGRHLLQEMTVTSYVTNNAYLVGGQGSSYGDNSSSPNLESVWSTSQDVSSSDPTETTSSLSGPSMLLLTGPNYSGKSVYLKSVAQIIYLAHLGSFVPCTSAIIGLTDALLTRIRTCETVSRPHSAFMIDLQQVAHILKMATRRSLVVIDEFGKGTDASDGAGLAAGVLKHLLLRGVDAPKVLAATHFHEIFEMGYLPPQRGLAFAHMEVRVDPKFRNAADEDTRGDERGTEVTYLYNLRPGRSSESFGTQCAAMNGIPAAVVERASQLSRLALRGEDLVSVCAGVGREEEKDLEHAETVARAFLELDLEGDGGPEDPRRILEEMVGESVGETEEPTRREAETGSGTEV